MTSSNTYNIGSTGTLQINFPTFDQTPECGYNMTYSYDVNGVSAASFAWLTLSTTYFQFLSSDRTNAGTFVIDLKS